MGKVTYRGADEIRNFYESSIQFKEREIFSYIPFQYHKRLYEDLIDLGRLYLLWEYDSKKEEITVEYMDER